MFSPPKIMRPTSTTASGNRIRPPPQRRPIPPTAILLVATSTVGCIICNHPIAVDASSPADLSGRGLFFGRRGPAANKSLNRKSIDASRVADSRKREKDSEEEEKEEKAAASTVHHHIQQEGHHQNQGIYNDDPTIPESGSSLPTKSTANTDTGTSRHLEPSQILPAHTNGGSILSALYLAIRTHFPPRKIARLGLTGCQLTILYLLFRATWQAVTEALDEISEDMDGLGVGGGAGSGVREEHDRTWLDGLGVEEAVQATSVGMMNEPGQDGEQVAEDSAAAKPKGRSKKYVASYEAASDLARRLRAAGMPMVMPPDVPPHLQANTPNSVQHVLKSLTKTEGRLLSSALLSPADDGDDGILATDASANHQDRQNKISRVWNDIGGLGDVKDGLLDLVFPLLMNQSGGGGGDSYYGGLLSNPPGVLLYGPPGTGKTSLVRALASTVNARVLCVTPSTLMRKYVGETELQVRALFTLARKIAPCIIFVDEVDGLFRERGSGGGGGGGGDHDVSRDLKTEFMQLWDGIRSKKANGGSANDQILIIGATNRPFDVDPGFLRRMPRSFFVGLPDRTARVAVLKSMLKEVPLSSDFDVEAVASATEFYSPSDLKELLRTAALVPLREARFIAIKKAQEAQEDPTAPLAKPMASNNVPALRPLTTADVLGAVAMIAPTQLSQSYVDALSDFANRAGGVQVRNANKYNNPAAYDASPSKKPYQHPSGYYVHKADDGSFLADIGTFSTDGHHPSSSGLGVFDSSTSEDEGYSLMGESMDEDDGDDDDGNDDDSEDDEL